jgi:predicted ester cyclase
MVPRGKQAQVAEVEVNRIADGKIEEVWPSWDVFGLLRQLDVLPS